MKSRRSLCLRHPFPPEIISHAGWLYHRASVAFSVSHNSSTTSLARGPVEHFSRPLQIIVLNVRVDV